MVDSTAIVPRKHQPAVDLEGARRQASRGRTLGIGGQRGRRDRADGIGIESVYRAVEALRRAQVPFQAQTEIESQIGTGPEIVLREYGIIFRLLRAVGIDLEVAAGGKAEHVGSQILSERRSGRIIERPAYIILAERIGT